MADSDSSTSTPERLLQEKNEGPVEDMRPDQRQPHHVIGGKNELLEAYDGQHKLWLGGELNQLEIGEYKNIEPPKDPSLILFLEGVNSDALKTFDPDEVAEIIASIDDPNDLVAINPYELLLIAAAMGFIGKKAVNVSKETMWIICMLLNERVLRPYEIRTPGSTTWESPYKRKNYNSYRLQAIFDLFHDRKVDKIQPDGMNIEPENLGRMPFDKAMEWAQNFDSKPGANDKGEKKIQKYIYEPLKAAFLEYCYHDAAKYGFKNPNPNLPELDEFQKNSQIEDESVLHYFLTPVSSRESSAKASESKDSSDKESGPSDPSAGVSEE